MRPITSHAINPANKAITLIAVDGPGPGGASHHYTATWGGVDAGSLGQAAYEAYCNTTGWKSLASGAPLPQWLEQREEIKIAWINAAMASLTHPHAALFRFQDGAVKENGEGVNGITHEVLLAVLIDRLQSFQTGQYANPFNQMALEHLQAAQKALLDRTRERQTRGVEGTHKV